MSHDDKGTGGRMPVGVFTERRLQESHWLFLELFVPTAFSHWPVKTSSPKRLFFHTLSIAVVVIAVAVSVLLLLPLLFHHVILLKVGGLLFGKRT